MKRRRRHGLDLLPLLDVFMVVLFVFATIQEQQLGASADETAALRVQLARAEAAPLEQLAAARAEAGAAQADAAAARAQLRQAEAAREEVTELRDTLAQLHRAAEQAAETATLPGAEALRRQDILARLIDHFSVFEIEIDGELGEGAVVNRCCYRSEPLTTAWRSCGQVPAASAELRDWLAGGGAGLVEALRKTKGGNALTIVRQNERATWHIGRKLEEQLRERFTDHKIYDEGVSLHAAACPRP